MAKQRLKETQVKHVALLANLKLNRREINKFRQQLSEILNYVDILNKLDTKGVEPTSQVTGLENVFRDDRTTPSLSQKETLSGTKKKTNNFFKVKAIFE